MHILVIILRNMAVVAIILRMDQTDTALIALLRQNARLTVADLAHKLKVSRGTVTNRLRKLDRETGRPRILRALGGSRVIRDAKEGPGPR